MQQSIDGLADCGNPAAKIRREMSARGRGVDKSASGLYHRASSQTGFGFARLSQGMPWRSRSLATICRQLAAINIEGRAKCPS
jgi:hypothetical protein